ncbi:electron transport protein [Paenibacillus xerothermodurans]|nr:electron transport protein [Paenibacillus xerothermodurans]
MNPPPAQDSQVNGEKQYDVWGQTLTETAAESAGLTPHNGAVAIDEKLLKLGRDTLYKETFSNEVFLTDIMGIVDGPFTITNMAKAIVQLKGAGTTNLQVELAEDVTLGDRSYKKGEKVDTGIDVPKGVYAPLGMPVKFSRGQLRVGISCMACHATVDPDTKMVIEGAPNADLNAGLLMALATNSAAYFTHTDVENVTKYIKDVNRTVVTSTGGASALPDPAELEKAVDANLVKWPKGNFDSTIDMKSNPAQIPDSFTKDGHPYGWSGFAAAGPFHGLSAFSNNVHAQNSDSLAQVEASEALFGMEREVYLGTLLQNAPNPAFRYAPASGLKPSEFFAKADPNPGTPGVNEMIKPPSFPKLTMMAPDGLFISSPGFKVGEQVNAMAAYQNTIIPPRGTSATDATTLQQGERVFQRAQCLSCHSGAAFTNHRVVSAETIGTEPSRAKALKKTEYLFGAASIYSPDTPVPVPPGAKVLQVPTAHLDPAQIKLAYAHGDSPGGYKVKGLLGLRWTAPYLHDGGVAAGSDPSQLGIPGTLAKGILPDPANSLKALVDRDLRRNVVDANKREPELARVHAAGIGHEYWVDQSAGFTKSEQDALIQYLLSLQGQWAEQRSANK